MEPQSSPVSLGRFVRGMLVFVIGVALGAAAMYFYAPKIYRAIYQARFGTVKNFGASPNIPTNPRILPGTVTAANGSSLTVRIAGPAGPTPGTRTVLIGASTKVSSLVPKGIDVFRGELDAFFKKDPQAARALFSSGPSATTSAALPDPFLHTPLPAASIKVGDSIVVTSLQDMTLPEFTAEEIRVESQTASSSLQYMQKLRELVAQEMQLTTNNK